MMSVPSSSWPYHAPNFSIALLVMHASGPANDEKDNVRRAIALTAETMVRIY